MKKLEELGISPAPWKHIPADEYTHAGIDDANGNGVGETYQVGGEDETAENANARLIAASPELYECLHEAVVGICHNFECCGPHPEYACNGSKDCFVKRWRAALAKAAGEEVANG